MSPVHKHERASDGVWPSNAVNQRRTSQEIFTECLDPARPLQESRKNHRVAQRDGLPDISLSKVVTPGHESVPGSKAVVFAALPLWQSVNFHHADSRSITGAPELGSVVAWLECDHKS